MIKIIAAVSKNGILGVCGSLPWEGEYKEDLQFFKKMTDRSTVIMGRKTFESIGKPLPNRRNIVVSKLAAAMKTINDKNITIAASTKQAIDMCDALKNDVWLIGGSSIYEAGMEFADEIYLTLIPKWIDTDNHSVLKDYARFPWINPRVFELNNKQTEVLSSDLEVIKYCRI